MAVKMQYNKIFGFTIFIFYFLSFLLLKNFFFFSFEKFKNFDITKEYFTFNTIFKNKIGMNFIIHCKNKQKYYFTTKKSTWVCWSLHHRLSNSQWVRKIAFRFFHLHSHDTRNGNFHQTVYSIKLMYDGWRQ